VNTYLSDPMQYRTDNLTSMGFNLRIRFIAVTETMILDTPPAREVFAIIFKNYHVNDEFSLQECFIE